MTRLAQLEASYRWACDQARIFSERKDHLRAHNLHRILQGLEDSIALRRHMHPQEATP